MKKKIYIYPPLNENSKNPYLRLLCEVLNKEFEVANLTKSSSKGLLDLLKHFDSEIWIFNWPENIPQKKFGFIQVLLFYIIIIVGKFYKKRIYWILHNKKPHKGSSLLSDFCSNLIAKKSDYVITHSKEGITYYNEKYNKDNIFYFPHPSYNLGVEKKQVEEIYDIIIWGSIEPYKNTLEFLKAVKNNKDLQRYKVLICGLCGNGEYLKNIKKTIELLPNISFENKFLTDTLLQTYIQKSKNILFTYSESSVLSSGALIYSLEFDKRIIGPCVGAFLDLSEQGVIFTYKSFNDIPILLASNNSFQSNLNNYLQQNTWDNFVLELISKNILK